MLGVVTRVLSPRTHLLVGRAVAHTIAKTRSNRSYIVKKERKPEKAEERFVASTMHPDAQQQSLRRTTDPGAGGPRTTEAEATMAATPTPTAPTAASTTVGGRAAARAALGRVVKLSSNQEDVPDKVISDAVSVLRQGGVIGVPTDTIYGLACLAQSTAGVRRIYAIKGRDERKPIAICVHDVAAIGRCAEETVSQTLLRKLLPGPVTLVLPRKPALNPELNPHTGLIGVRVPDFPFVRKLVEALGEPLALTSANRSGEQSCISCTEFEHLWPELNAVYDAGTIESSGASRLGSTVVDVSRGTAYRVIRAGSAEGPTLAVLHEHGLVASQQDKQDKQQQDGAKEGAQGDEKGAGEQQAMEKSDKRGVDDNGGDNANDGSSDSKGEPSPKKSKSTS